MGKDDNKVKCKYIYDETYNPRYVNGAQGGINTQGEIIINFYLQRSPLPKSQTFTIVENQQVLSEIESEPDDLNDSFVRVVENGVIMNYQTAKEFHKWLGFHIKKIEELDIDTD